MKNSSHIPTEPFEKQHYKKRYLERRLVEQDADKQIKEFDVRVLQTNKMPHPQDLDQEGYL